MKIVFSCVRLFVLGVSLCVFGCAHYGSEIAANKPVVVTVREGVRLNFSGKGTAAGVMLMSSMGPAGIAVGIAIDKGVEKSIAASAEAEAVDIGSIILNAFSNQAGIVIGIEQYGFAGGSSAEGFIDPAVPIMSLSVLKLGNDMQQNQAVILDAKTCDLPLIELSELKTDGVAIERALKSAADCLAKFYRLGWSVF